MIPLLYALYNVSYALFSVPAGQAADRFGSGGVIILGYLFLIVGYLTIIVSSSLALLVIGLLFAGTFAALTDGVQRSHLSHLVGPAHKGEAYGYLNGAVGLGSLVAGIGGGYLWQAWGSTTALLAAIGVVALGLAVFFLSRAWKRSAVGYTG